MTDSAPAGPGSRRRVLTIGLLGLVSGLPYLLSGSTLTTWLRSEGVALAIIGYFGWVQLPYTFKPLWAPLLDRFRLPFLGRRRGWMLLWQVALALAIAAMAMANAGAHITALFVLAAVVAFSSASLDIVIDAYRTDVLSERERGPGAAVYVTGYRVALLLAGAGALVLADHVSWRLVYLILAGLMLASVPVTLLARPVAEVAGAPRTLRDAVVAPLREILARPEARLVFAVVLLFKLGEGLAGHLIHPFLVDVGFTKTAIGAINKGAGLPAAIAGTLLGGVLVTRLGVRRSLLWFGAAQAAPNLLYMVQHAVGADRLVLIAVVSIDQMAGGLATAAFVAYLMSLCDRRYTAFQYALLSSASSLLGRVASGWSGVIAADVGWSAFFVITAVATVPVLVVLWLWMPRDP